MLLPILLLLVRVVFFLGWGVRMVIDVDAFYVLLDGLVVVVIVGVVDVGDAIGVHCLLILARVDLSGLILWLQGIF